MHKVSISVRKQSARDVFFLRYWGGPEGIEFKLNDNDPPAEAMGVDQLESIRDELKDPMLSEKDIRANIRLLVELGVSKDMEAIRGLLQLRPELRMETRAFALAAIARMESRLRKQELESADPFHFPLSRFLTLSEEERVRLVWRAHDLAKERIAEEFQKRGAVWIVLLGDEVVASSNDLWAMPSSDEVLRYGKEKDIVPYLFSEVLIEESGPSTADWAETRYPGDRYPTIPICIRRPDNTEMFIQADLDTGAAQTFIDSSVTGIPEPIVWSPAKHLGEGCELEFAELTVLVTTGQGTTLEKKFKMLRVRAWDKSPFIKINTRRRMLVGRDLLRFFGLEVVLRSAKAQTEIASSDS